MSEVCGDNRFELIGEFKGKLVEGTNIETSPEEMAVLDNILFRFWQMGWLDKLKAQEQKCRECGGATSKAIQELQAKLKAQEPRVLTLDEVKHFVYGNPYIIEMVLSDGEYRLMYGLFSHQGVVGNCDFATVNERIRLYDADYGKTWRVWTGCPTPEQRWQNA